MCFFQLVVVRCLCRPIVLSCPLVLSSLWLVVACWVASVAISICAILSSSHHTNFLLCVARLCHPIWLHHPLVLSSCQLVVASCVTSVILFFCAALSPSCHSRFLCCHIMLRRLLVFSACRMVVACCAVPLHLALPSHCTDWLLHGASHLPEHAAPRCGSPAPPVLVHCCPPLLWLILTMHCYPVVVLVVFAIMPTPCWLWKLNCVVTPVKNRNRLEMM